LQIQKLILGDRQKDSPEVRNASSEDTPNRFEEIQLSPLPPFLFHSVPHT